MKRFPLLIIALFLIACQKKHISLNSDANINRPSLNTEIEYLYKESEMAKSLNNQNIDFILLKYLRTKDSSLIMPIYKRYEELKWMNNVDSILVDFSGENIDLNTYTEGFKKASIIRLVKEYSSPLYRITQVVNNKNGIYILNKMIQYDYNCYKQANYQITKECLQLVDSQKVVISLKEYYFLLGVINGSGIKHFSNNNLIEGDQCMGGGYFQIAMSNKHSSSIIDYFKIKSVCTTKWSPFHTIDREVVKLLQEKGVDISKY